MTVLHIGFELCDMSNLFALSFSWRASTTNREKTSMEAPCFVKHMQTLRKHGDWQNKQTPLLMSFESFGYVWVWADLRDCITIGPNSERFKKCNSASWSTHTPLFYNKERLANHTACQNNLFQEDQNPFFTRLGGLNFSTEDLILLPATAHSHNSVSCQRANCAAVAPALARWTWPAAALRH